MSDRQERYQYIYGNTVRKVDVAAPAYEPVSRPEEVHRRPVKKTVKHNPKVLEFNGRFTAVLALSIMAVVLFCVTYLYGQSVIGNQMNQIARKQTTLATLRSENQSLEANLEKKVDYDAIKEQAGALGMVTPTEQNTIYYEGTPSDYVRQYAEIPVTEN